jgi:hypothetical protein
MQPTGYLQRTSIWRPGPRRVRRGHVPHLLTIGLLAILTGCEAEPSDDTPYVPLAFDEAPPPACGAGVAASVSGVTFPDLQTALDASTPWSVVWVCPGRHVGGFSVSNPGPVAIQGTTGDASDVVLDGDQLARVLTFNGTSSARVRDLTLTRGRPDIGGMALTFNSLLGRLELWGVDVVDNVGVFGTPTSGVNVVAQAVWVYRSSFRDNWFDSGSALSASVSTFRTTARPELLVLESSFLNNGSDQEGSAVEANHIATIYGDRGRMLISDSTFEDNYAAFRGAAAYLKADGTRTNMAIRRSAFRRNVLDATTFPSYDHDREEGGAVHLDFLRNSSGGVAISDVVFEDNVAVKGSALSIQPDLLTGVRVRANITRTSFLRNGRPGYDAFALNTETGTETTLTDVDFGLGADANLGGDWISYPLPCSGLGPAYSDYWDGNGLPTCP